MNSMDRSVSFAHLTVIKSEPLLTNGAAQQNLHSRKLPAILRSQADLKGQTTTQERRRETDDNKFAEYLNDAIGSPTLALELLRQFCLISRSKNHLGGEVP